FGTISIPVMKRIVIDARGYSRTTGRYMRNLIKYLEELEGKRGDREYVVLLHRVEFNDYTPRAKNFSKRVADFPFHSFSEQLNFLKLLYDLKPDLVHFTMPQQPVLYWGKHVTTM